MPWNPEYYNMMKPKIIHTKTFSCDDDHPIVYYTFDDNNKAMCDYCATKFVYEPKKKLKPTQSESDDPDYRYGDFRDEIMAVETLKQKEKL